MNLNEYQEESKRTAVYNASGIVITAADVKAGAIVKSDTQLDPLPALYVTLGLVGESGEIAEKMKKIIRDNGGRVTKQEVEDLVKELGDVLWYVAQMASELGVSLEKVAEVNIEKLTDRRDRGKLGGSGDNR